MPEIVEVCLTTLFLNNMFANCELTEIKILGGRYANHELVGLQLFNNSWTLKSVNSKGKFIWFDFDDYFMLNRLGTGGGWTLDGKNAHVSFNFKINNQDTKLYFINHRHQGTIKISNSVNDVDFELDKI